MTTGDVSTTKRKPLTPTQRLALYEAHKGICGLCGLKIRAGESWIDEHLKPLGLGGSNNLDNRAPVHIKCAAVKTHDEDMPRITKAKAQKRAALGIKDENRGSIKSGPSENQRRRVEPVAVASGMSEIHRRFQQL